MSRLFSLQHTAATATAAAATAAAKMDMNPIEMKLVDVQMSHCLRDGVFCVAAGRKGVAPVRCRPTPAGVMIRTVGGPGERRASVQLRSAGFTCETHLVIYDNTDFFEPRRL